MNNPKKYSIEYWTNGFNREFAQTLRAAKKEAARVKWRYGVAVRVKNNEIGEYVYGLAEPSPRKIF